MTNITFKLCSFENCNLRGADFSSAYRGTLFRECLMHGCRSVGSDMTEAIFRDIDLSDSDLSGANLVCRSPRGRQSRWHNRRRKYQMVQDGASGEGAFIAWKCCSELRGSAPSSKRGTAKAWPRVNPGRCGQNITSSIDETISYDWAQSTSIQISIMNEGNG